MAQINFIIPDDKINSILDAFADVYGFVPGNGETKAQFTKRRIRDYIKEVVVRSAGREAQRVAINKVQADTDAIEIT